MARKKTTINIAIKLFLIIFAASFLCSLIIGAISYQQMKQDTLENIGSSLQIVAQTVVLGLNMGILQERVSGRESVKHYKTFIKDYLVKAKKENNIKEPFYLLEQKNNNTVSVVSSTESADLYGSSYHMNKTLRKVFKTKKADFSPLYTYKDGLWISGYAPVKDDDDNVLVVLEVNREISFYINKMRRQFFKILIICFGGCLLGLAFGMIFIRPILKNINILRIAASEIERSNYDYQIKINSHDEIGHLAFVMEHMRRSLKGYISRLKEALEQEKTAHLESIKTLSEAIAIREPYTKGHIKRVSKYAELIAREMGLDEKDVEILEYGCILHDVGKIGVNVDIINKDQKLDEAEYDSIKKHPEMGVKIIEGIPFLEKAKDMILYHQECYDGSGYPKGLKGEQIPILARIVSVADTYDAIVSDRSYRKGASHEEAVKKIKEASGTQFDPKIVDVFMRVEKNIKEIHDIYEEVK